jgi:hypothetical protein
LVEIIHIFSPNFGKQWVEPLLIMLSFLLKNGRLANRAKSSKLSTQFWRGLPLPPYYHKFIRLLVNHKRILTNNAPRVCGLRRENGRIIVFRIQITLPFSPKPTYQ